VGVCVRGWKGSGTNNIDRECVSECCVRSVSILCVVCVESESREREKITACPRHTSYFSPDDFTATHFIYYRIIGSLIRQMIHSRLCL
jgi:hypothetical protein